MTNGSFWYQVTINLTNKGRFQKVGLFHFVVP